MEEFRNEKSLKQRFQADGEDSFGDTSDVCDGIRLAAEQVLWHRPVGSEAQRPLQRVVVVRPVSGGAKETGVKGCAEGR